MFDDGVFNNLRMCFVEVWVGVKGKFKLILIFYMQVNNSILKKNDCV